MTDAEQIALRERCTVRQVNMTISLAFLAPKLVRAAVEGRLPRGINIEHPVEDFHLKRSMIPQRRSQDLVRCLFGTVAIPRRSPDRPEAGRAYQVDKGAGAIPNARVSLARKPAFIFSPSKRAIILLGLDWHSPAN